MAGDPILLDELTRDYERLQRQKCRDTGGVEARVLTNLAMLADEHYVSHQLRQLVIRPLDANKLHLVFNLSARLLHKVIGRLNAINGVYKARPDRNDTKSKANAEVVTKLTRALDEKVGESTRNWERLYWMAVAGVVFEYVPWVKDAVTEPMPMFDEATGELLWRLSTDPDSQPMPDSVRQEMIAQGTPPERFEVAEEMRLSGDVGSEIISPLQVFMDSSVRSVAELAPDQSIYIAKIRTIGWIQDNFELSPEEIEQLSQKSDLKIVTTSFMQAPGATTGSSSLEDLIPRVQGTRDEDDPPMVVVVERFMGVSSKNPHGRYTVFVPGECVLLDGPNPYEEIPIVDFHWSPPTTNFWTKDFLSSLVAPQRFLNKRMSQLGEQANASIYSNLLLGPGITADKIAADYPSPIENAVTPEGMPLIRREDPPALPNWFLHSIDLSIQLMKEIAGGADLFAQNKFPGQLRGPMAVPMLQEIMDTEWGPLYQHIGERTARVKQMRVNRVKKFYPPYRTLHYTGNDMRDEVFVFHKSEILSGDVEYTITVERGSLLPELRALAEERVMQRLNSPLAIVYTDERTGRLDKSKIAQALHEGDPARESREMQARKLAGSLIDRIEDGEQIPPYLPMPFWDHRSIMDEFEAKMQTTEFLESSPTVIQGMMDFWNRCRNYLEQIMSSQQDAVQNQMIQGAVAQAAQQTAAKVAAETTEAALRQTQAGLQEGENAPELLAKSMAEREQEQPNDQTNTPRVQGGVQRG